MNTHTHTHTHTAVVCWGVGEEGKVEEIQVDPPKSSQVRLKMLFASICHTDHLLSVQGYPAVSLSISFFFFNKKKLFNIVICIF